MHKIPALVNLWEVNFWVVVLRANPCLAFLEDLEDRGAGHLDAFQLGPALRVSVILTLFQELRIGSAHDFTLELFIELDQIEPGNDD